MREMTSAQRALLGWCAPKERGLPRPNDLLRWLPLLCWLPLLWLSAACAPLGQADPAAPPATEIDVATSAATDPEPPSAPAPAARAATAQPSSLQIPVEPDDAVWGNADAPVTIVEFSDFQCPYCAKVQPTLQAIKRAYGPAKVRFVYKHQPLPFHEQALPAAMVAQAVLANLGDEAFFRFADRLFKSQAKLDTDNLVMMAAEAGLDARVLMRMLKSGVLEQQIEADQQLARQVGADGTPAFRINGITLSGAQPLERFTQLIDAELQAVSALRGVGRHEVYAQRVQANFAAPEAKQPRPIEPPDTTVWKADIAKSPALGPKDALVTLVEFSDFECPFCAKVQPTLKALLKEYPRELRLVFKHNPLPFHKRAPAAANLAIEAYKQKRDAGFWAVHDLLFASSPELGDDALLDVAKQAGLLTARAKLAITKLPYASLIQVDEDLADDLKASGTPHFFINGRRLTGARPIHEFRSLIDEELAKAKQAVSSGVPRGNYYAQLMKTAQTGVSFEVKQAPAPTKANPSKGAARAPVVIQIFSDLQCPFCSRVRPALAQVEKKYAGKVRFVWRNLPLPFHKQAEPAAAAAMEVFAQKGAPAFWRFIDAAFDAQRAGLDRDTLELLASKEQVDVQAFNQALDDDKHLPGIQVDKDVAKAAGVHGTPGFIINGYYLSGAQPFRSFQHVIDRALQDARLGRKPAASP